MTVPGRVLAYPDGDSARGGQGAPVDTLACGLEVVTFHIHAHLTLIVDGQQVRVPAHIGITDSCLYSLHTHDHTGLIHVEAAAPGTFTLGQLFDIWGYTLAGGEVAGNLGAVSVFVNGASVPVATARDISFANHDLITLEVGTPIAPPPYEFPSGF